ncbi:serine/arginine repetitive matrix protein 4 isoform X2 [Silurus meridionalis]|nr:serine/arginine repetitive matrix protein 4 isoform X2 [Silurus meridionalis]
MTVVKKNYYSMSGDGQVDGRGQTGVSMDYDVIVIYDIVICGESREQVEKSLERWRYVLERRGMKVSRSKTEYMCVNERKGSGKVRLQGEEVEKVEEFRKRTWKTDTSVDRTNGSWTRYQTLGSVSLQEHLGTSRNMASLLQGEKQLFDKFWRGTFKAVATPRPESVIIASIAARRETNRLQDFSIKSTVISHHSTQRAEFHLIWPEVQDYNRERDEKRSCEAEQERYMTCSLTLESFIPR